MRFMDRIMDPVNRFNHTSLVAVFSQIDRLKSIRNRCLIEHFGSGFYRYCTEFSHISQMFYLIDRTGTYPFIVY